MAIVLDASAVLAIYFGEPEAEWVATQIGTADAVLMSTVNLTECLIHLWDRQPVDADELQTRLLASGIDFVAPDAQQATLAAEARLRLPLNLGDCFAYALAKAEGVPLLALDRDFRGIDVPLLMPSRG